MLFLVFHLDRDRYAIPTENVREVVPFASLKALPQAPEEIAGILNYHRRAVPVADLVRLACGRDARAELSTRIILVTEPGEAGPLLGLIAEQVTDVRSFEPENFQDTGVKPVRASWLGKVVEEKGLIQWIDPRDIFPKKVLAALELPQLEAAQP